MYRVYMRLSVVLRSGALGYFFFFCNDTATTEIYTLSLHDALPICAEHGHHAAGLAGKAAPESQDLGMPGARLRQAERCLHRLRTARIELRPVQVAGRELRQQLDQRRAVPGREAADVNSGDLALQRRHVAGQGATE